MCGESRMHGVERGKGGDNFKVLPIVIKSRKIYRLSTEYQNIIAPVSGYVNSVGVNTLGETVTSAQQLVTIVPDNTSNEMLCYVKNTDIADVELGMNAEIKLEAYPYNKYGTVKGTVKYISPSSFANEQLGNVYCPYRSIIL